MKLFLWVFGGLSVCGLLFWMMVAGVAGEAVLMALYAVICAVMSVGAFWMMYFSVRHEKRPLPMFLLAFVPFASLWYYFERVRPRRNVKDNRDI